MINDVYCYENIYINLNEKIIYMFNIYKIFIRKLKIKLKICYECIYIC